MGFIPTCVGTGCCERVCSCIFKVHPHVRGDRPRSPHQSSTEQGSSPRAWGQVEIHGCQRKLGEVHPHVRGDRATMKTLSLAARGSSPRAWGQVTRKKRSFAAIRFIPTCVGTGRTCHSSDEQTKVHPHVRGDRNRTERPKKAAIGSSPRAWGQGWRTWLYASSTRFIPTCVGTGQRSGPDQPRRQVHPHVRGDRSLAVVQNKMVLRFIPTCVGTGVGMNTTTTSVRFIPTCVGTGTLDRHHKNEHAVHPHVRGDRFQPFSRSAFRLGSSPRAWGQVHSPPPSCG